jgi:hypothetical protein
MPRFCAASLFYCTALRGKANVPGNASEAVKKLISLEKTASFPGEFEGGSSTAESLDSGSLEFGV